MANMTNETQATQDDPRTAYTSVTNLIGDLIAAIEAKPADVLTGATPCPEFTVADLLDHVVMVQRRAAKIGSGGHFSEVQQDKIGSGWTHAFRSAAEETTAAWADADKLGRMFEVPWGQMPGWPLLITYTGELAVHGWDLGQSVDEPFTVADELLAPSLMGAKFIPAEGRDSDEIPFSAVVDPGPDASVLDQLAGWMGRNVV